MLTTRSKTLKTTYVGKRFVLQTHSVSLGMTPRRDKPQAEGTPPRSRLLHSIRVEIHVDVSEIRMCRFRRPLQGTCRSCRYGQPTTKCSWQHRLRRVTVEASSWDTAEALRDKDFVPCKSYSSSHRPSPGKRDEEKSQINAFYETVVAARGRDVLGPPDGSCHRVAREHGH